MYSLAYLHRGRVEEEREQTQVVPFHSVLPIGLSTSDLVLSLVHGRGNSGTEREANQPEVTQQPWSGWVKPRRAGCGSRPVYWSSPWLEVFGLVEPGTGSLFSFSHPVLPRVANVKIATAGLTGGPLCPKHSAGLKKKQTTKQ